MVATQGALTKCLIVESNLFCKYFHVPPGCMWIYLAPFYIFLYTLLGQPNKHLITEVLIIIDGAAVKLTLQHLPINKQTDIISHPFI